jgi:hypothetical protein
VAELNFEALEMAARRQALRLAARALEQRLNADTSDHGGPELPYRFAIMAVTGRPSKAHWELSTWNGLTTTVTDATTDSARGTRLCGWNCFR